MNAQSSHGERPVPLSSRFLAAVRAHPALSLLAVALAAGAAFVAASAVGPGPRGQVAGVVEAIAGALRDGDVTAVMTHVSPYFSCDGIDRDSLRKQLASALRDRPLARVSVSVREVQIAHGRAGVKVHASSRGSVRAPTGLRRSEWFVILERIDDRWLVREIEPIRIGGHSYATLAAVLTAARHRRDY